MSTTPNLSLETWDSGNSQPELLYNSLLSIVDALVPTPVALDKDLTAPPSSPAVGSLYIVGSPATGLWEGKENSLVAYTYANAWMFILPKAEWLVRVEDEDVNYRFDGSAWNIESGSGGFVNPMTTAGDLIVGGSGGSPTRLGIGSNGQILTVVGGVWTPSTPPSAPVDTAVTALSIASGVVNIDLSLGNLFTLALTANITSITFSNVPASGRGTSISVRIRQDATGGRTVTLPSSFKAISGSDSAVQTAANAYTVLNFTTYDQGTRWEYVMKGAAA